MRWITSSPQETQNIGGLLAGFATKGDCITLSGDLGMGKTTFARGFVQALVPGLSNVTSPSFTLVNVYEAVLADGTKCPLWHVDLYRLKDASELPQLALEDAFDTAILLVEWPDMADSILPQERLRLEFRATDAFDTREIVATGGAFLHRLNG